MKNTLFQPQDGWTWRYVVPFLTLTFFSVLIVIAIFNWRITSRLYLGNLINHEVKELKNIFETIDKQCKILSFDYQKNRINFLTIQSFVGSEVGSMNLAHPEHWQGPYLDDNPTYQGREYIVVRTKKGYFITPDVGVTLPNGAVIDKDIILDEDADIAQMMTDENQLMYSGKSLALPLKIKIKKY